MDALAARLLADAPARLRIGDRHADCGGCSARAYLSDGRCVGWTPGELSGVREVRVAVDAEIAGAAVPRPWRSPPESPTRRHSGRCGRPSRSAASSTTCR
jgi:hypothetical protein